MLTNNNSAEMPVNIITNIETFDDPLYWMGYRIIMSDATKNITGKIENTRNCCEKWGIHTKSNLNDFIGAEYFSIHICEQKRKKYEEMRMIDIIITTNR